MRAMHFALQEVGHTFVQQLRPCHHWLTFLINYGGQHGVFDAVAQVRSDDCAVRHALGTPCCCLSPPRRRPK
jgi:hypothetical protein